MHTHPAVAEHTGSKPVEEHAALSALALQPHTLLAKQLGAEEDVQSASRRHCTHLPELGVDRHTGVVAKLAAHCALLRHSTHLLPVGVC